MDVYQSHATDSVWKGWVLQIALYLAFYHEQTTAFMITTPYSLYVCPEGQNVTLTCKLSGPLSARHDLLYKIWYFSSNGDQRCSEKQHIRNVTERDLHHEPGKHHGTHSNVTERYFHGGRANHHGLETTSDHHGTFNVIMMNLTLQDSGNYCCYVVETKKENGKQYNQQMAHGFMELRIQKAREAFPNCTYHAGANKEKENITAAALATGACIVGILCLPLILILIYKQRQAVHSRRNGKAKMNIELTETDLLNVPANQAVGSVRYRSAHELVRMESNAQGIENPVFEAVPSTNTETRPKPQMTYIASRQQSESGRHLLSEPNTPLSPPGTGDCFFPTLEPVPDSPNSMKV